MKITFTDSRVVREFFKDILTGKDGDSYDVGRIIALLGAVGFVLGGAAQVLLMCHDLFQHAQYHEFPFMSFGTGFAAMAGGCGGLLWLKKDTEPDAPPQAPSS